MTGLLIVIAGPSGVGKGTVIKQLMSQDSRLALSISCTTRDPRPGEQHGREYFFLTDDQFVEKINAGDFLEWAMVHGKRYGTDNQFVREQINAGYGIILEIDVQGAEQVRAKAPDAVFIFIAPPSMDELERRLRGRNTETEEKIRSRLAIAQQEMSKIDSFEYQVRNIDVDRTVTEIKNIIDSERGKKHDQNVFN